MEKDLANAFWNLYKCEREARMAKRYHVLALLCDLTPVDEMEQILRIHSDTILNWIEQYNEGGLKSLSQKKHSEHPSKLNSEKSTRLKSDILPPPRILGNPFSNRDGKTIRYHIKKNFGIEMTRSGVYTLFHRIDLRLVTPPPKPAKADKKKSTVFKRIFYSSHEYKPGVSFLFGGETFIEPNRRVYKIWWLKRERLEVLVDSGRKHLKLVGAINETNHTVFFLLKLTF